VKRFKERLYLLPNMSKLGMALTGLVCVLLAGCSGTSTPASPTASNTPASTPVPEPPPAPVEAIALPTGTRLEVRTGVALSTGRNRVGDKFDATLEVPVDIRGREVLTRGSRIRGHVTTSRSSGRLEGRAVIGITLDAVEYQNRMVPIVTSLDTRSGAAHKKRNIEMIGGGAGVGALIGAIAGGGKGAAIGAAAGAGAGTGTAALTGKQDVEIPAETLFSFKLKSPVQL
jgi:hypothetical protein